VRENRVRRLWSKVIYLKTNWHNTCEILCLFKTSKCLIRMARWVCLNSSKMWPSPFIVKLLPRKKVAAEYVCTFSNYIHVWESVGPWFFSIIVLHISNFRGTTTEETKEHKSPSSNSKKYIHSLTHNADCKFVFKKFQNVSYIRVQKPWNIINQNV
jgi:hypothetical protein